MFSISIVLKYNHTHSIYIFIKLGLLWRLSIEYYSTNFPLFIGHFSAYRQSIVFEVILFSLSSDFIWVLTVKNQPFVFCTNRTFNFFFSQNHWINPLSSCLNMDQGSHPIIYTCTLCNIWTVAKNRYQVTRCMRCSNPLKLIEVCIAFTCCSYLVFLAVQLYTVSKILFSLFDIFFTEKRGEAKTMVVYKTQISVLFLASFEGSIWIDKDKKKYLHCNNQKNNNQ